MVICSKEKELSLDQSSGHQLLKESK